MRSRLVLVHGLLTSRTMWRPQLRALADAGFATHAPDLPGHGARTDPFTLEGAMATIDHAVASLPGDGPVILVGLSLGGYLAIEYAGRSGRRVDGLIAMACTTTPVAFGLEVYRGLGRVLDALPDKGRALEYALQTAAVGPYGARAFLEGGHSVAAALDAIGVVAGLDPIGSLRTARADGVPVWLVSGQFDQMRIGERAFHAALPEVAHTIVPLGTHLVSLAEPDAVNAILVAAARAASR